MAFRGTLSAQEASHFFKYELLYRFPHGIRMRIAFITTAVAVVAVLYFYTKGLTVTLAYVGIALCAIAPFAMFNLLRLAAHLKYRLLSRHFLETEVILDTNTIEVTQNQFTIRFPWSDLKVIAHTPYGLMFFLKKVAKPIFALPNRVFDSTERKYEILSHASAHSTSVADMA